MLPPPQDEAAITVNISKRKRSFFISDAGYIP